jgi:predicted permease
MAMRWHGRPHSAYDKRAHPMIWLRQIAFRLRAGFGKHRRDRILDEELNTHLALLIEENIERGMSPDAARREAKLQLGGADQIRESVRESHGLPPLERLWQDLRYAFRMLRKSPGFTAVAVLTLALGIGANIAILAVMKAVLWPNLPYPRPGQLVDAYNRNLKASWDYAEMVSIPLLRDWQQRNHSFVDLAATGSSEYLNLSGVGEAARIRLIRVTPNIFSVLGLEPLLGRGFREDEAAPGRDRVAILSYSLWKDKFGARSDIIAQTIHLSRESYTVIGVLPENFQLGNFTDRAELLLPLDLVGPDAARRDLRSVFPIGRLKPAVSVAAAKADLSAITERLAKTYPSTDGGWGANVIPLHDDLVPFGSARLAVFLGLAGLVLLIACLNIAVLSCAQAETRRQEFAIRAVLGASRARLVRQSLCESALLSIFGTAGALLFASWGTRLLIRYTPPHFLNNIRSAPLDMSALAAAVGMCVSTMLLIGLLPAVSSFNTSLNRWLGRGSFRVTRSQRGYVLLVGGEVAIGLALVVGAGLLARSLQAISKLDVGFNPQSVVSARVTLDPVAYPSNASRVAFFDRFLEGLQARPDLSVSAGSTLPLSDVGWLGNLVSVPGAKSTNTASNDLPSCSSTFVYPGYFATLGTPILMGRDFAPDDADPVVIVNEAFARQFFRGQNPIGKFVLFSPNVNASFSGAPTGTRRIIGVVKDMRDNALRYNAPTFATAFFSYVQNPVSSLDVIVRSSGSSAAVALLRQRAAQLDPSEPLYSVQSMTDEWQQAFGLWRFQTLFGSLSATLALLISAIGVYGVVSHSVKQRTREIGIRIALGGQPSDIIRAMLKRVSRAIAVGIACGLFAAFALTRHLSSLLFHVAPFDPATFILGPILLTAIAVLACYIPARRAMRVDPMVALRYE